MYAQIESTRLAPVDVVAIMADEDKDNLPVERQPKCAIVSFITKGPVLFSIDDKDLEEAIRMYLVKNTVLNNRWAFKKL